MKKPHDDTILQMQERIRNVLTTLNRYRANNIDDRRIEDAMTQIEEVADRIENGGHFTHQELLSLDFHLTEGSLYAGNEHLNRELYSIRNYAENMR